MTCAIDVNLLLYASDASSPFHGRAKDFLQSCMSGRDLVYLPWPTVMSYLRIVTHPSIFDQPLSSAEAMANVGALLGLPNVRCLAEADGFWDHYNAIVTEAPVRGNQVPDAHLAALLRQHGVRTICTHDRDFRRFGFLDIQDPLTP